MMPPHPGNRELSCTLKFRVKAPGGLPRRVFHFQSEVDGRFKPTKDTGRLEASYDFSGVQGAKRYAHDLTKGVVTAWNHDFSGADFRRSSCPTESVLTISLRATLRNPTPDDGFLEVRAVDGYVKPNNQVSSQLCRAQ